MLVPMPARAQQAYNGSKPMLCAMSYVMECDDNGQCERQTPESKQLPRFVRVDAAKCTLCLSCVGACPEGALIDNPERPQLRFIERNCVQCGLCETTCPEDAITLAPRLLLADAGKARRQPRVLRPHD